MRHLRDFPSCRTDPVRLIAVLLGTAVLINAMPGAAQVKKIVPLKRPQILETVPRGQDQEGAAESTPSKQPRVREIAPLDDDAGRVIASTPTARFDWEMRPRYYASWRAWDAGSGSYDRSFVNPRSFRVTLNACGSDGGGSAITQYRWDIPGVYRRTVRACKLELRGRFKAQGAYQATLTIRTSAGTADSVTREIVIRDWLIVSLGDSLSSGEGNPDRAGAYSHSLVDVPVAENVANVVDVTLGGGISNAQACAGKGWSLRRSPRWQDQQCHRSALSGPALAAERLENSDPHSSVTFLSFACSGARVNHLFNEHYEGQDPSSGGMLRPQVEAARASVGGRRIDALLMSAGINDLNFSDKMKNCVTNSIADNIWDFDICAGEAELVSLVRRLPDRYRGLDRALQQRLDVSEIYIFDYPTEVLLDERGEPDACECLDLGATLDLDAYEIGNLTQAGHYLNHTIATSAAELQWNFVHGMRRVLKGGGYCADRSNRMFRRVLESTWMQGPNHGGMHPNVRGHDRLKGLLLDAIVLGEKPEPIRQVTVTFKRIKLGDGQVETRPARVEFRVTRVEKEPFYLGRTDPGLIMYYDTFLHPEQRGRWFDLPDGRFRFSFPVYARPVPLRYTTHYQVDVQALGKNVGGRYGPENRHGAGTHTEATPAQVRDGVSVEYAINVRDLRIGGGTRAPTNDRVIID